MPANVDRFCEAPANRERADMAQLRIGSGKDEAEPGQIFWPQIPPKALNKQPLATASLRPCLTSRRTNQKPCR